MSGPAPAMGDPGQVAQLAKVFSHPLRVAILWRLLDEGQASPAGLARALGAPTPDVSYHVRELSRHGLVRHVGMRPTGRAPEHVYELAQRHGLRCVSAELDRAGLEEVAVILEDAEERLSSAKERSARRVAREGGHKASTMIALASVGAPKAGRKGRG